jgi:hypothetical protein
MSFDITSGPGIGVACEPGTAGRESQNQFIRDREHFANYSLIKIVYYFYIL